MKPKNGKYYGIYRGIVLDNEDLGIEEDGSSKVKAFGRCKVFFDGIYPEKFKEAKGHMLPWAEPIFPIFGGNAYNEGQKQIDEVLIPRTDKNWTNRYTGWCSIPHIGAYVWGFFQDGNINYPKFFGMTQAGNAFMSEHKDQHVFISDNVKIIIDENPLSYKSTNKFNSNNTNNTATVKALEDNTNGLCLNKKNMPTTVNIEIVNLRPPSLDYEQKVDRDLTNDEQDSLDSGNTIRKSLAEKYKKDNDFCAINLNIVGNVNAKIKGNVYEEIEGDKFITHTGNSYIKQTGDIEIEHYGNILEQHYGQRRFAVNIPKNNPKEEDGNNTEIIEGFNSNTIKKDAEYIVAGNRKTFIAKDEYREAQTKISDKSNLITHN